MPQELTAEQAAALLKTTDTLGMPLGPGQPPAFLRALGEREDWTDLRVHGALLAVLTELFSRTGVRYLSGFFGPLERALRAAGCSSSRYRISTQGLSDSASIAMRCTSTRSTSSWARPFASVVKRLRRSHTRSSTTSFWRPPTTSDLCTRSRGERGQTCTNRYERESMTSAAARSPASTAPSM
jgi:hypothetical protein